MATLIIFGEHDEQTLAQLADVDSRAVYTALMADGHLGYIMPIGGVAAYDNKVSVAGVGFDIGCGNLALKTSMRAEELDQKAIQSIAFDISEKLEFGLGGTHVHGPSDHPMFDDAAWLELPPHVIEPLRDRARSQIGTIGAGNHYVDVFADEEGWIWVGVHFGSRGLGHTIASGFMSVAAGRQWGERAPEHEALLDLDSELGKRYWALMNLAGTYARVGREWVADKVVHDIIGTTITDTVHNHHNFAWKEEHFDQELIVVRKGATPAFPGQRGFVGGSMGDDAVILQGNTSEDEEVRSLQQRALFSTIHGAGRVMSRSKAKGSRPRVDRRTGRRAQRRAGLVTHQMMKEWIRKKGVFVVGGDVDESPHVYRRLDDVIKAQGKTIEVLHRLRPLIVVMAGANVRDPYKD